MSTPAPNTSSPADAAPAELSPVVIRLLKGVLYREDDETLWRDLLNLQATTRDYVAVLGLELMIDEAEGYAFLRSRPQDEAEGSKPLPRLMARRPLSFPVSLLLALLRRKLAEFDAGGADTRLVLSRDDIVEMIRVFLPESSNETRLIDQVDAHINKVVELGFLRRLRSRESPAHFEVRRIIKAFVDAQWLTDFDQRLAAYQARLEGETADD